MRRTPGRIVVVGASSGLGRAAAMIFARIGWQVAVAARREERLREMCYEMPGHMTSMVIDVTAPDVTERFQELIDRNGGMDILLFAAGCGWNNPGLDDDRDRRTVDVNVVGFTAITEAAFRYFRDNGIAGQIAAITSIAGTKGIGVSATYSATKRYQWSMLQAYGQLSAIQRLGIAVTDIRPGFVDTDLLDTATRHYPMIMSVQKVAPRIVKAILRRRRVVVIDRRWAFVTALWRCIPAVIWRRLRIEG